LAKLPIRSFGGFEPEAWHERRGAVVDAYQRGAMNCRDYFQALSETTDGVYTPDEVERIHLAWTREEYPGVQRLIAELNALPGVTTACLSNTNHAHWQRLSGDDARGEYPAVRSLRHRLASHLMGCLKPDPAIYARAHDTLSEAHAGVRVVFFDDLLENVEAARAHGWTSVQVDPDGDTAAQMRAALGVTLGRPS